MYVYYTWTELVLKYCYIIQSGAVLSLNFICFGSTLFISSPLIEMCMLVPVTAECWNPIRLRATITRHCDDQKFIFQ